MLDAIHAYVWPLRPFSFTKTFATLEWMRSEIGNNTISHKYNLFRLNKVCSVTFIYSYFSHINSRVTLLISTRKKVWTYKTPMRNNPESTKYPREIILDPREKICTHKILTTKKVIPTKYPREKKFVPMKYLREKKMVRWHDCRRPTMARGQWNLAHSFRIDHKTLNK